MSYPIRNRYKTFQGCMAGAHSIITRIQHEIDGLELSGPPSVDLEGDSLNDLVDMKDTYSEIVIRNNIIRLEV